MTRLKRIPPFYGKFKRRHRYCRNCNQSSPSREEKLTDVNIASTMLVDAAHDQFDTAFLMSGDADLVPAVEATRLLAPEKEIVVVFPYRRINDELKRVADRHMRLKPDRLERHQLPRVVPVSGGRTVECPPEWR